MYENLPQLVAALEGTGMLKEAISGEQLGLPGTEAGGSIFRGSGQTVGPAFSPNPIPDTGLQKGSLLGKGSLVNRLGSRMSQGAKDLWGGGKTYMSRGNPSGGVVGKLMGGTHKFRNRAGLIGGAALLAAGIPAYLASQRQQKEQALNSVRPGLDNNPAFGGGSQEPQYGGEYGGMQEQPYDQGGYDQYSEQDFERMLSQMYGKQANYSPSAAGVAAPPSAPRVTAPGPGVASIPTIKPGEPPKLPKGLNSPKATGSSGGASGISGPKAPSIKTAESDAVYPLAAAAAGGVGGHMAGEKLIQPYLKARERAQQIKIRNAQAMAKTLKGAGKTAPATVAAAGALLLAALTALAIKRKQKGGRADRQPRGQNEYYPSSQDYDPTGAGFAQHERQEFGHY